MTAVNTLAEKYHIKRVIECVGIRPAQKTALAVADKGATVVMFGVSDAADELPINLYDAFLKELTIKTSFVNPFTTQRAINILNNGANTHSFLLYKCPRSKHPLISWL